MGGVSDQTLADFLSQLAAGTPAPGGGAAAAVAGALGAALVGMVAGLTVGRPRYAAAHEEMLCLQRDAQRLGTAMLACADSDRSAFEQVMAAYCLPKSTPEERAERRRAIDAGLAAATEAPLQVMKHAVSVMRAALAAVRRGNPNACSDAHVAYLLASAAFEGALSSAASNLALIRDDVFRTEVVAHIRRLSSDRTELQAAFGSLPGPLEKAGLADNDGR